MEVKHQIHRHSEGRSASGTMFTRGFPLYGYVQRRTYALGFQNKVADSTRIPEKKVADSSRIPGKNVAGILLIPLGFRDSGFPGF